MPTAARHHAKKAIPCPFCGHKKVKLVHLPADTGARPELEEDTWITECANRRCHAHAMVFGDTPAQSVARWNVRGEPIPN
jgi:hypothetical protein